MLEQEIMLDAANATYSEQNIKPLYKAHQDAEILIIGQAPGAKTVAAGEVFRDASGNRLRAWLGVDETYFYSPKVAVLPMDFYFPGKGKTGDLPPRKDFAAKWHPRLLALMPNIKLTILIGSYAIKHYLNVSNVTTAVSNYAAYLPKYFPLIHPSPLNARWISKNLWFNDVITNLQTTVKNIIDK